MAEIGKGFKPGEGYSKADWDAVESPEMSDYEITRLRPARDVLAPALFDALAKRGQGQRGRQKAPVKSLVSIRLDQDVIAHFRAAGPHWQSRMNAALRKVLVEAKGR